MSASAVMRRYRRGRARRPSRLRSSRRRRLGLAPEGNWSRTLQGDCACCDLCAGRYVEELLTEILVSPNRDRRRTGEYRRRPYHRHGISRIGAPARSGDRGQPRNQRDYGHRPAFRVGLTTEICGVLLPNSLTTGFPGDHVHWSPCVAALRLGLNYASGISDGRSQDRARRRQGQPLMHFFSPEITFALPSRARNIELLFRFHHRSGVFGLRQRCAGAAPSTRTSWHPHPVLGSQACACRRGRSAKGAAPPHGGQVSATLPKRNPSMTRALLGGVAAMAAIVVASNILVQFLVGDWLTWGAFTYPFAFLVTDLMNRLHGPARRAARGLAGFVVGLALQPGRHARSRGRSGRWSACGWRSARARPSSSAQLLDVAVFDRLRHGSWWRAPLRLERRRQRARHRRCSSPSPSRPASPSSRRAWTWPGRTRRCRCSAAARSAPLWVSLAAADFMVKLALAVFALVPFRVAVGATPQRGVK